DLLLDIDVGEATAIELVIRGTEIRYEASDKSLYCLGLQMPVEPVNGRIDLRILVDRVSLEIFAVRGQKTLTACFMPSPKASPLQLSGVGGVCRITAMDVYELRSAWPT
ncbi:MAG: GH32 C-terminal domain-containing protein, partial [Gammaproteobacteria bacterium]|nr:GH32 C-terminal domain-containing protein [Gammaproteobacteria bacterium]